MNKDSHIKCQNRSNENFKIEKPPYFQTLTQNCMSQV